MIFRIVLLFVFNNLPTAPYSIIWHSRDVIVIDVFSVIVIEELFPKVIIIDPKVIGNSLLFFYYIYCCKLTEYQVCLHVIPAASNCKQCTDDG